MPPRISSFKVNQVSRQMERANVLFSHRIFLDTESYRRGPAGPDHRSENILRNA